jgi:hypothetical protein
MKPSTETQQAKPEIIEAAESLEATASNLLQWACEPDRHFLERKVMHERACMLKVQAQEYRTWVAQ